jgi:uncharacterized protein (TIGR02996 family)
MGTVPRPNRPAHILERLTPMAHSDATADAFLRRILANPTDVTPRLVFADWLEETGVSSNIAWAHYLRLAEELANTPPTDARHSKLAESLRRISRSIRAKLMFRAETLTAYPDAMLRLLPARNLIVNVETVVLARSLVELVPESVAWENRILLMGILEDRSYLFAAIEPIGQHLTGLLEFVLNCRTIFVGMKDVGVNDCLSRNYGAHDVEVVDSVFYFWLPTDGLKNGPAEWADSPTFAFSNSLILDACLYAAQALEFEIDGTRLAVWFWRGGEYQERKYLTARAVVSQIVPLLCSYIRNPITAPDGTLHGEISVEWWGQAQTLPVRITDRPKGHHVMISIPPISAHQLAAPNPTA